jgi:predicted ester cyclase
MSHRNVIEAMFKAVDARDYGSIGDLLDPDCEFAAPGVRANGRDVVLAFMRPFLDAFPDLTHEVATYVEDGDRAAVELHIRGTHTAPLASPQGDIPPTGKTVDFWSCDMVQIRDSRFAIYHVYFDQMEFMQQLGLIPS